MSNASTVLVIGTAAEGPMPVVVVTDEDVTTPVGTAYLDLPLTSTDTPGPVALTGFVVPLEQNDAGEYLFGDKRSAEATEPLSGPMPALPSGAGSDRSIAARSKLLVGNTFGGERVEIRVPPGTIVRAPALDAPLLLKGSLGGVDIHSGDLVCLDVDGSNVAAPIKVQDARCVYGVIATSGGTTFRDVDELRLRVERAPERAMRFMPAAVRVFGTDYLEVECGHGADASAETSLVAARIHLEGDGCFYGHGAQVASISCDSPVHADETVDDVFAGLSGRYGILINRGGPAMSVSGVVDRLYVRSGAKQMDFSLAAVCVSADIELSHPRRKRPDFVTTMKARAGCAPSIVSTHTNLDLVGPWLPITPRASAQDVGSLAELERIEARVWRDAPSARYERARAAVESNEARDRDRTTQQSAPPRVRNANVRPEGFGTEPYGSPTAGNTRRPAPLERPQQSDPDGPDLGFGYLN